MAQFYAVATNKDGKHVIIYHNETFTDRLTATLEAERMAKQMELRNFDIRPTGRSEGRTMTKFNAYRKLNKGNNPREYNNAL